MSDVSVYSEKPSECSVEMEEQLSTGSISQYSYPPSECSVEIGGVLKNLTGPLPDFENLELSCEEMTCLSDSFEEPLQLTDYLNTAFSEVATGRDHHDDYLNTAASDVSTGRDELDDYLNTATADVLTGRERPQLTEYLNTATADVLTGRDEMDDFLNTAASEVATARGEGDVLTDKESEIGLEEHDLMTGISLGGSKGVDTALQRTDSVITGLSLDSLSEYSDYEDNYYTETNVEVDGQLGLYPQSYISKLEVENIYTPAPTALSQPNAASEYY
ncbi:unnamed protein product [Bursaphelenchus okinawaensis]|uniref:Uncharacterized protein n=1 Tax=Bursaphelenchus okinawaensis TaxID=465554 RepID=A0A811KCZ7_9BILA|nr:unnamed protein product [Bursaphelenchus okinawaensis]CAG9097495.1 unnamed protein product [Bursaphelenchus okinawaensis]